MLRARVINPAPSGVQIQERRGSARYSLWLPVVFQSSESGQNTYGGFTRDVSSAGAFIVASQCPPAGAQVVLQVVVPVHAGTVMLECMGQVTRVQSEQGCSGFAVSGSFDENKWTRLVNA